MPVRKRERGEGRRNLPWKRRQRRLLIVVALLTAVLGSFFTYRIRLRQAVAVRLEAVRAAGLPVTGEELNRWEAPVPEDENAALVYRAAFDAYGVLTPLTADALPLWGKRKYGPLEDYPEEVDAAIGEFLAANADALTLLHEAAALPRCDFGVKIGMGGEFHYYYQHLAHLEKLRIGARMLALEADLAVEEGAQAKAARSLVALLALADSLGREPVFLSQLMRMEFHELAYWTLQRGLNLGHFEEEELLSIAKALDELSEREVFHWVLVSRRCAGVSELMSGGAAGLILFQYIGLDLQESLERVIDIVGASDMNLIAFLDVMEDAFTADQGPFHEWPAHAGRIERKIEELGWLEGGYTKVVVYEIMGYQPFQRVAALVRMARTTVAVERFGLAEGRMPERLEDLVPDFLDAVPIDPYDGEALRVGRTDSAYKIYSVGQNRTDEGGVEPENPSGSWRDGDLVFEVALSPRFGSGAG